MENLTLQQKLHILYLVEKAYDQGYEDGSDDFVQSEMSRGTGASGFNFDKVIQEIGGLSEYNPTPNDQLVAFNPEKPFSKRIEVKSADSNNSTYSIPEYEYWIAETIQSDIQ